MPNLNSNVPGVNGIVGLTQNVSEATAEEMHGGPVNPAHANWGEQAEPYSWESQLMNFGSTPAYSTADYVTDYDPDVSLPAGVLSQDPQADRTPSAGQVDGGHASVRTVTLSGALPSQYDAINSELPQSRDMHASNLGAGTKPQMSQLGLTVQQDDWREDWEVTPGASIQDTNVPRQLQIAVAGFGSRSREQSMARQNEYGFDSPHLHRRSANGHVPGNFMWMMPGSRPLVKTAAGPARPAVGVNSPFSGDDVGATFSTHGAVLTTLPSEYQAVPVPQLAQPVTSDDSIDPVSLW